MRELCKYSSTLNVLHFMMDHFQTDIFLELIMEESLEKQFQGFTMFRENLASSDATSLGLPPVFTGEIYDGSIPVADFYTRNIAEKGFQNVLSKEGFKLNVVPNIDIPFRNAGNYFIIPREYASAAEKKVDVSGLFSGRKQISELMLKQHNISDYDDDRQLISLSSKITPDLQTRNVFSFMKDYTDHIEVSGPQPVYHFVFIFPPHPPYVINHKGEFTGTKLKPTRENFKIQAKHTLKLFVDLMQKLKIKGLYDNTLIVLQSDHGGKFVPIINGSEADVKVQKIAAMLAVKPPFEDSAVTVSDAFTMNSDMPATIMDILGMKYPFMGESVFKINPDKERPRYFVAEKKERYLVNGSLYSADSWVKLPDIMSYKGDRKYEAGSEIQFGLAGNAENYQGYGWSVPSDEYTWSDGNRCSITLIPDTSGTDLILNATFFPYLHRGIIDKQRVTILVDKQRAGEWIINKKGVQTQSVLISGSLLTGKELLLEFEFPDARSPVSLNLSPDKRILTLGFIRMSLQRK